MRNLESKYQLSKYLYLFWFGGSTYATVEVIWREHSSWTMVVLGGLLFILIGLLNQIWSWDFDLVWQVLIGDLIALIGEFVTGCIVNLRLGWNIWSYEDMPYNLFGQICPQFALLWIPLVLLAIILDDWIRWKFYHERKPKYKVFGKVI